MNDGKVSHRIAELGLLFACPFDDGPNPWHCQLHEVRKLPERERAEWLRRLSNAEAQEIIERHRSCRCWIENHGVPTEPGLSRASAEAEGAS